MIPSIEEVEEWLQVDDTDENTYVDGIWMCGDFAAMLMTRAKTQNWRMRIATAMYSYEGDSGYASQTDPYGSAGHAFNYIECIDGIWYIEPQSDGTWYFSSGPNKVRMDIHEYYTFPFVGSIWDGGTIWVNFYGDFA